MSKIERSLLRLHDLRDSGDPLKSAQVDAFEKEIGAKLPRDYREFLLLRNGGHLSHHTQTLEGAIVTTFCGITQRTDIDDLRGIRKCFLDRIPGNYIPIGGNGRILCMCLSRSRHGWLYEWDRSEEMTTPFEDMAFRVSPSFTALLTNLQPSKDDIRHNKKLANGATEPCRCVITFDLEGLQSYLASGGDPDASLTGRKAAKAWAGARTALMLAAQSWPRAVRLLIEHGADVHRRDQKGNSALDYATRLSYDCVKLLLEAGANPLERDGDGQRPADYIQDYPAKRTAKLINDHLRRRGVKWAPVKPKEKPKKVKKKAAKPKVPKRLRKSEDPENVTIRSPNALASIAIPRSGCQVYLGPRRSHSPSQHRLDLLVGFGPRIVYANQRDAKLTDPVTHARYQACRQIFSSVGRHVTVTRRGVKLGEVAECVTELYDAILELTAKAKTARAVEKKLTTSEKTRIARQFRAALRKVCTKKAT